MVMKQQRATSSLCSGIRNLALLVLVASCGVEPTGWEGTIRVDGQVSNPQGVALSNIVVTEIAHGQQVASSSEGKFTLFTDSVLGSVQLGVRDGGSRPENQVQFSVPTDRGTATIALKLSASADPEVSLTDFTEEEGQSTPEPDETPQVSPTVEPGQPTPRPGPTKVPSSGPFSSNGDTTSFGIPAGLKGNIGRGAAENRSRCLKCHGERGGGYRYGQLKKSVEGPLMRLKLSQQTLADLTAYLNRGSR
jgi:hypothetical protein